RKILAQARAAFAEKTEQAAGELARFRARAQGRVSFDLSHEFSLTLATADAVLRGLPVDAALEEQRRQREKLQQLQGALTDFRISWYFWEKSLLGRHRALLTA